MDVTALLIIEPASEQSGTVHNLKTDVLDVCWPLLPKAFLPLLGRPLVFRLVESLALSGVRKFRVICAADSASPETEQARHLLEEKSKQTISWAQCKQEDVWTCAVAEAEKAFASKTKALIVARCESYFELGSATALTSCIGVSFARLTSATGTSNVFWATKEGSPQLMSTLHRGLAVSNAPEVQAMTCVNALGTASDLRQLTEDAFNLQLAYRPVGRELRPGVWVGDRTRIHRTARIVAPAYIGSGTKIRAAALVTRGSSIEHHCEVDCGTVVQASNLMPYTYVGAGLELLYSVAGSRHRSWTQSSYAKCQEHQPFEWCRVRASWLISCPNKYSA